MNATFDRFGSLNARPILHHAAAKRMETSPALGPRAVSRNEHTAPPGTASSSVLAVPPPPDSLLPAPAQSLGR